MDEEMQDVVLLRDILARELETINNYQSLLERARTNDVIEFISHIIDEEKEHVAEAMELINRIDPKQAARFGAGAHYRSDTSQDATSSTDDKGSTHFTVGSLRNSR
jgi:rubrerythrin